MSLKSNWRTAKTNHADTLQKIAARELQDASRWPEIVSLNSLRPPYLTGDPLHPGIIKGEVLRYGSLIKVPAPALNKNAGVSALQAFGADVGLTHGLLMPNALGGLSLASGIPNLKQSLQRRLEEAIGCLQFHPRYGNSAHRLKGRKQDLNVGLLALRYCEETLLADPRIKATADGVATVSGDALVIGITAFADDGTSLRLQLQI